MMTAKDDGHLLVTVLQQVHDTALLAAGLTCKNIELLFVVRDFGGVVLYPAKDCPV